MFSFIVSHRLSFHLGAPFFGLTTELVTASFYEY